MNVEISDYNFRKINGEIIRYGITNKNLLNESKYTIIATSNLDYSSYVLRKRKTYQQFQKTLQQFKIESSSVEDFFELFEEAKVQGIYEHVSKKFIELNKKLDLFYKMYFKTYEIVKKLQEKESYKFTASKKFVLTLIQSLASYVKNVFDKKSRSTVKKDILTISKEAFFELIEIVDHCLHSDYYCSVDFGELSDLIGDWTTKGTEYIIDENGECGYSAIIEEEKVLVVWSKETKKCELYNSIRFSNAGDLSSLETDSGHITFNLPKELFK